MIFKVDKAKKVLLVYKKGVKKVVGAKQKKILIDKAQVGYYKWAVLNSWALSILAPSTTKLNPISSTHSIFLYWNLLEKSAIAIIRAGILIITKNKKI